ncbi:MAG: type II secretion system F family protein, partial [Pseudobdellovibrionaceae bacterium]
MKDTIVPFLMHDWIFIPSLAGCAFVLSYVWADKVLAFLYKKSLGQKDELTKMLDMMFVEVNPKHLTALLLLLSFGLGALFFILFWPQITFGVPVAALVTILGWSIPKRFVKNLYEKRCDRFVDQMVDGMTIMANGIKSGLSITQCMERVVENLGNPISQEFSLVLAQTRVGRSVEEALLELGERIPRPDEQMFVTSVTILKETGGNMAETFQSFSGSVR